MRKQFEKIGPVVMLAVILTAILSVDARSEPETLVLEIDFGNEIFNTGNTSTLNKGVRTYQEWGLLDAHGATIGEYRFHAVSTQGVGAAAWYGNEAFDIFGEGVIEGISQADLSVFPPLYVQGSIIGGTGRFAGASGEYSTSGDIRVYTFTFDSDDDSDSDSDSDSD